jgi:membrane-associated protease RseP (regulator of RpoE activity)
MLVLAAALSAAIIPHELAHTLVARAAGLSVSRLALGFGPRIVGRTVRGTALELRLVPAGGFAQIDGLDAAPRPVRFVVALAGPVVNLLLAGAYLIAATVAAGAVDPGQAVGAALEIGVLLFTGTGELIGAYAADPGNLTLLPIAGLPSTALAAGVAVEGGLPMLCILVAALSLSTGVVNLLPYPPLDGAIALGAITNRRFGRRSALAVDALLLFVLVVNLGDGIRVVSLLAG